MKKSLELSPNVSQQLKLTPSVSLSLEILQLSSLDLENFLISELEANPLVEIEDNVSFVLENSKTCLLYTSPSPPDRTRSRMPSSA
jgi:RNA polymerase sigma-54 factor